MIKKLNITGKKTQLLTGFEKAIVCLFFFKVTIQSLLYALSCLAHVEFGKNSGQEMVVARLCVPHPETE